MGFNPIVMADRTLLSQSMLEHARPKLEPRGSPPLLPSALGVELSVIFGYGSSQG